MIEKTQSTDFAEENFIEPAEDYKPPTTVGEVLENLKDRMRNAKLGGVNCIPLPFPRFRSEIPGIEQGKYITITANQKVGKTNFSNFLLFNILDYCYNNPNSCSCHIIYFALEESKQKIIERYMSYLLYNIDGIRISPQDLRSTSSEFPVSSEILAKLEDEPYKSKLDFFERHVQFETEDTNPTGILRVCEKYAKTVGTYLSHKQMSNGNSFKEVEIFDSYIQNDPNHFKIVVIDHIGLVDKEQGFSTKAAVDKLSEYCVKYLRNRYNFTCMVIQQQAAESEGLEAIKQKRMLPSTSGLGDSKYTGRDADLVLGLFDPSKFGLSDWKGYKIYEPPNNTGLGSYARFLYVLANRDGEMNGMCPLFFDGATCTFTELPKLEDINALSFFYNKPRTLKSWRQEQKSKKILQLLNIIKIKKLKKKMEEKIDFSIDLIDDPDYVLLTEKGYPVKVLTTTRNSIYPIVGLVIDPSGHEDVLSWQKSGLCAGFSSNNLVLRKKEEKAFEDEKAKILASLVSFKCRYIKDKEAGQKISEFINFIGKL